MSRILIIAGAILIVLGLLWPFLQKLGLNRPRTMIIAGAILIVLGLLWPFLQKLGLGRLPGDIVIERENFSLYVPITTSLLASFVLSLVLWLLNR